MDRARNAWTIRRLKGHKGASKRSSNERNLWLKPISSPARTGHREGTKIYSRLLHSREFSGASLVFVVLLQSSSFRRPSGVKCFSPLFWDDDAFATNSSPSSKDDDHCAIVGDWITITIVSLLLFLLMMMMSLRTCWRSRESNTIRNLCVKQLWITNGFSSWEGVGWEAKYTTTEERAQTRRTYSKYYKTTVCTCILSLSARYW